MLSSCAGIVLVLMALGFFIPAAMLRPPGDGRITGETPSPVLEVYQGDEFSPWLNVRF